MKFCAPPLKDRKRFIFTMNKTEIRSKIKILRKNFEGAERRRADEAIVKFFLADFSSYGSFFIYNSFSSEARTDFLIAALLKEGKRVYLPRVEGRDMVAVPYGVTKKGAFGIPEPLGQPYNGEIEVTVIPLLAVNSNGFRVGYGGGFYDRYLKGKDTLKVGIGYGFQFEEFNEDSFDVALDKFICEKGIFGFEK